MTSSPGVANLPFQHRLVGVRVGLVEDHVLFAESLRLTLRAEGAVVDVIGVAADASAADGAAAIVEACLRCRPQVVLLDLSLGEGVGGALDLGGEVGSALHHVAALAGVSTPGLSDRLSNGSSNGLRNGLGLSGALGAALAGVTAPFLGGTARSSLDGGGGHEGKDDVEELHVEGLDWKREGLKKTELVELESGVFCELKIADEDRWMMIVKMKQTWRRRRALYLLLGEEDVLPSSVLVGLRLLGCCLDERRRRCYSNPD